MNRSQDFPTGSAAPGFASGSGAMGSKPAAIGHPSPQHRLRLRPRRWLWPLAQAALTAAVLWWVLGEPGVLATMGRMLHRARPLWLGAGLALGGVWIWAQACRWRVFLRVQGVEMGVGRAWAITMIGMFFTLFLPGGISADAARMYYAMRYRRDRKTGVVLSVIMDHLGGMVALMGFASLLTFSRWHWFEQSPLSVGALYFLVGFFAFSVLGLAATFAAVETHLVDTLPRRMPGRAKIIELARAIGLFCRNWRASLQGVAWSVPIMAGYFGTFYCAARAFGIPVSLKDIFSIMPVVDVVSALPVTISGLGVREQLFVTLLGSLASVPKEPALLISLGGFACTAAWSAAGGVVFPLYRARRSRPR